MVPRDEREEVEEVGEQRNGIQNLENEDQGQLATFANLDEHKQQELLDGARALPDSGVSISGLAGRFPKSDNVNEFERNLREGHDMVNDEDNARFACRLWDLPPRAGRLNDLSRFDAAFFGYSRDEANMVDYQMRILYEVVYESILDAGLNPATLRGSNTGVFFGFHCNEFETAMADDPGFKSQGYYGQFATRIAQYFDLRGLTVTFDAACASGFVGLHHGVDAISRGLCERAIVCSSNIPIHPTGSFIFLQMQMLSPTGYSRFMDSRADGYVKSESVVSVLLQRKDLALRNYANFIATMTSVDGFKREGITFPSDKSQESLIRATKNLIGLSTNHVEYFEAHGTGTPAGDPQEVKAIAEVYSPKQQDGALGMGDSEQRLIGPLLLGSVKTNMGHSEAASGLCALTKIVLMLDYELIYPSLHYNEPNANIESLKDGRVAFVGEKRTLRAKVVPLSCYGFGGSNVHAIVRANELDKIQDYATSGHGDSLPRLVLMFGRGRGQLEQFFDKMLDGRDYQTKNCLSDDFLLLLDSLSVQKIDRLMTHRGFMIVNRGNREQIRRSITQCELGKLESLGNVNNGRGRSYYHFQDCKEPQLNLIFGGLGSSYSRMGAGLRQFPVFWSTIERLSNILRNHRGSNSMTRDLVNLMLTDHSEVSLCDKFCSIAAYEIGLVNLFISEEGLNLSGKINQISGHSLGEIAAAYAADLLGEQEAIKIACELGKTLQDNRELIAGRMVALELGQLEAEKLSTAHNFVDQLAISCINGPQSVTISGSMQDVDAFCAKLTESSTHFVIVEDSIALHNQRIMNGQICEKLRVSVESVVGSRKLHKLNNTPPAEQWIPLAPNEGEKTTIAEYFARAMCEKLDFGPAIDRLASSPASISLELSPAALFEAQFRLSGESFAYLKCMKKNSPASEQPISLLQSIGQLYQAGLAGIHLGNLYSLEEKEDKQLRCRRQTPSLSSLFKWDHEEEFFVPRYPLQFSKSSAKCEMPVDIMQERDKHLLDHCIEGRCLFPATGYLFLVWRVFSFTQRKIYDACFHDVEQELVPVEFQQVRLSRAVILGNRVAQLYVQLEESTGRFEIKEGGAVVVDGWVRSPREKPEGLLYESVRERIREEKLECEMTRDDIYKQFRVSGYDYGESFQNITEASGDGRFCRVKFNGHFVALTDSILQLIFLAVTQYAPSGGLFLPTRFDYIRFQPEVLKAKVHEANMKLDLSDGHLNTKTKRAIMTKIMEREGGVVDLNNPRQASDQTNNQEEQATGECENGQKQCIFDTYCDPVLGIIITDGIEMRGIKASPAPRKTDTKDVLLESYQFVADTEEPIRDELLTGFEHGLGAKYDTICEYLAQKLISKMRGDKGETNSQLELQLDQLREQYLRCSMAKLSKPQNLADKANEATGDATTQDDGPEVGNYDIKKNGDFVLLSLLDQFEYYANVNRLTSEKINEIVRKNRVHLMRDLLSSSFVCERLMRPLVECVLENSCLKKPKISMLEINEDDGLLRMPITSLIKSIEPNAKCDYLLAHPEPARIASLAPSNEVKTHVLKDIQSLLTDQRLRDLDLILYKDASCYASQQVDARYAPTQSPETIIKSLGQGVKRAGFLLILMRFRLTPSELALRKMMEESEECELINGILEQRVAELRKAAKKCNLLEISSKSDLNGCLVLLYKRTCGDIVAISSDENSLVSDNTQVESGDQDRLLLRVTHKDETSIEQWLCKLKEQFKQPARGDGKQVNAEEVNATDAATHEGSSSDEQQQNQQQRHQQQRTKIIWLCAVDTIEEQVSGVVGLMQALRKELGPDRLRCFYDQHTFANRQYESVTLDEIEQSESFKLAVERDLVWNCVSQGGLFGSYRHFTIDSYMSHENCLCDTQQIIEQSENTRGQYTDKEKQQQQQQNVACYVNNAARGDLSSFTWFEAPYKYLDCEERDSLVQVCYSALNFRDIMIATGRLPLDALPLELAMSGCHIGLEFAGVELATGKRVMGMVPARALATHISCPPGRSIKIEIPDSISMADAASVPVVYATVVMALIYRGKMQAGETILIHAGSGGVGQAAIRVAFHYKLEVFTTVGSEEKRQFLLEEFAGLVKEENIFSSRDCAFERKIMAKTRGRGVDLVLNSLADDKLQASIRCLADGGRFLEIGKYDMSMDSRLELIGLDNNKTVHGILLDKLFESDDSNDVFREQLKCVMETIKLGFEQGFVKPIKHTIFKRHQVEDAFRFMATGKHIGKVLIEINPNLANGAGQSRTPRVQHQLNYVPRFQVDPQAAHIVTGGLGGFGLELIKWLVSQGAKRILITSRRGLRTGYQKITLRRLEKTQGVKFSLVTYDTTTGEGVAQLLEHARELGSGKIGSIFHLAMVLKDSLLENMSTEDFKLVCLPKITTCQLMDSILQERNLQVDHFVTFSSVTSGKGNAGQANYAYANSLLERVCERRQARGLHGLAIQWGAIGDVGAAYENLGGNNIIVGGTIPQRIPSCHATLAKLLCAPFPVCLSVVPVNRSGVDGAGAFGAKGDLVAAILHVLGIKDASKVAEEATLGELGLDSLMAVEIRQYIEREYDMTLNMQEIRSLTIGKIREISEKGADKASLRSERNPSQQQPHEGQKSIGGFGQPKPMAIVESYGSKQKQSPSYAGQIVGIDQPETNILQQIRESSEKMIQLDINSIGGFKPELSLPSGKFRRLNACDYSSPARPLFFLPPIHGSFELLEPICQLITNRPCIGLNWSKSQVHATSMNEVVERYLDNLQQWKWPATPAEPQVDLVGYSFGATVAFEMMIRLYSQDCNLKPGALILLDGSPRQIEMGSQLMGALNRKSQLSDEQKVDEMLMAYILSHTKHLVASNRPDFVQLQARLRTTKQNQEKIKFASETLCSLLNLSRPQMPSDRDNCSRASPPPLATSPTHSTASSASSAVSLSSNQSDSGAASDSTLSDIEENGSIDGEQKVQIQGNLTESTKTPIHSPEQAHNDMRVEMELAMEAFIRRYDIVEKYKCPSVKLDRKITLIRAEKVYLKATQKAATTTNKPLIDDQRDDLGLSSLANEVELHVLVGNHETFLEKNCNQIARIIDPESSTSNSNN